MYEKVFAFLLIMCMLFSVTACRQSGVEETSETTKAPGTTETPETTKAPEPEELVTIYVVTEQKNYTKFELESTATFEYDDRGRPTAVGFEMADGFGRKTELAYDETGNLVWYRNTQSYASGGDSVQELNWNLSYTDGLLTRAERPYGDGSSYVLNFSYNDAGQLVLVEYPRPEKGEGGYLWQNYVYDENGRLISETRCTIKHAGGFSFDQVRYFYDADGRLTEQCFCYAQSDTLGALEDLDELVFEVSRFEHYFFYYDEERKLAYVGDGADDAYPGGSAEIYSDEDYTFDENGNLVRVQRNEHSWVEYTYAAIEINESDVVVHKRLIHGISNFTLSIYNTMDPLFSEMCPSALYSYHLCSMSFYYLIPYPQFELFL